MLRCGEGVSLLVLAEARGEAEAVPCSPGVASSTMALVARRQAPAHAKFPFR